MRVEVQTDHAHAEHVSSHVTGWQHKRVAPVFSSFRRVMSPVACRLYQRPELTTATLSEHIHAQQHVYKHMWPN